MKQKDFLYFDCLGVSNITYAICEYMHILNYRLQFCKICAKHIIVNTKD